MSIYWNQSNDFSQMRVRHNVQDKPSVDPTPSTDKIF